MNKRRFWGMLAYAALPHRKYKKPIYPARREVNFNSIQKWIWDLKEYKKVH